MREAGLWEFTYKTQEYWRFCKNILSGIIDWAAGRSTYLTANIKIYRLCLETGLSLLRRSFSWPVLGIIECELNSLLSALHLVCDTAYQLNSNLKIFSRYCVLNMGTKNRYKNEVRVIFKPSSPDHPYGVKLLKLLTVKWKTARAQWVKEQHHCTKMSRKVISSFFENFRITLLIDSVNKTGIKDQTKWEKWDNENERQWEKCAHVITTVGFLTYLSLLM